MSYNSATSRLRCTAGSTGRLLRADAGDLTAYAKAVPADLVLMAGVFGNISDADVRRTIGAFPQLCADGATVIWTRTRRAPDLTLTGQAWSPWAAGVLSGGPRRRTDGEDPAQRVPGVKGAPCFGPQGLQGRVTGVRRCDRLSHNALSSPGRRSVTPHRRRRLARKGILNRYWSRPWLSASS